MNILDFSNDIIKIICEFTSTNFRSVNKKTRELRNKFIEETKGMNKSEREKVYEVYNK